MNGEMEGTSTKLNGATEEEKDGDNESEGDRRRTRECER